MRIVPPVVVALLLLWGPAPAAKAEEKPRAKPSVIAPRPDPWPRPRVLVRALFDPPFGPGAGVTLFVNERWSTSVELIHRGPFGPFYEVGTHFWPRRPRGTHHDFGVGVGGDLLFTLSRVTGGFAALFLHSLDLHYLARPLRDFGFVLGGKIGLGVAFEARDFGAHARRGSALDHFGFQMTNYIGFSLGSQR